jgi:hypothetical protein
MGIVAGRHQGPPAGKDQITALMRADGPAPHAWGNVPGDTCGWREHSYQKVLHRIRGRITFHTGSGDADISPGNRLALPPHTRHAATADGVRCAEAARHGPDADPPNTRSAFTAVPAWPGSHCRVDLCRSLRFRYVIEEPVGGTACGPLSTQPRAFLDAPQRR